jgi:hypothetical protein
VKFGFIAKHRGIWPANWLCEALGVSRDAPRPRVAPPLPAIKTQPNLSTDKMGCRIGAAIHSHLTVLWRKSTLHAGGNASSSSDIPSPASFKGGASSFDHSPTTSIPAGRLGVPGHREA